MARRNGTRLSRQGEDRTANTPKRKDLRMNLYIFGLGYSAQRFVALHGEGFALAGSVRSADSARLLREKFPALAIDLFDGAQRNPDIDARLAQADALLVSAPAAAGDPVLAHYAEAIAAAPLKRIVYLSTIGVYGDHQGRWIDESAPRAPDNARLRARVGAEDAWRALGARAGKDVFILRLAGIYGPGQNALVNLREGHARRIVKKDQVFNRIHVDDIAQAIAAALTTNLSGRIVNVTDDEPAPPQDVIAYAAGRMGVAPPPEIPFETAQMSPMAASFWSSSKRVSNQALRRDLGVRLKYPTYREGIAALAEIDG